MTQKYNNKPTILFLLLSLLGCSTTINDRTQTETNTPEPLQCGPERWGQYSATWDELGVNATNDCGPMNTYTLFELNGLDTVKLLDQRLCFPTASTIVEDSFYNCSLTNYFECRDNDNEILDFAMTTTQLNQNGSHVAGTISVTVRDASVPSLPVMCTGVYNIDFNRR